MIDEIISIRIHAGVQHTNLANSTFGAPISSRWIATATAGGPLPAGQIVHHHHPFASTATRFMFVVTGAHGTSSSRLTTTTKVAPQLVAPLNGAEKNIIVYFYLLFIN